MSANNYTVEVMEFTESREFIDLSDDRGDDEGQAEPHGTDALAPILRNRSTEDAAGSPSSSRGANASSSANASPSADSKPSGGDATKPIINIDDSDDDEPTCSSASASPSPIQFLQRAPVVNSASTSVTKKKKKKAVVKKKKKTSAKCGGKDKLDTLAFAASIREVADRFKGGISEFSFEYRSPPKVKPKKSRKKVNPNGYKLFVNSRELAKRTAAGFCVCK